MEIPSTKNTAINKTKQPRRILILKFPLKCTADSWENLILIPRCTQVYITAVYSRSTIQTQTKSHLNSNKNIISHVQNSDCFFKNNWIIKILMLWIECAVKMGRLRRRCFYRPSGAVTSRSIVSNKLRNAVEPFLIIIPDHFPRHAFLPNSF